jgi:hypothetical protein
MIDEQPAGSLVTDKTLVIMNAPSGIDVRTISQIVSSLAPVK